MKTERRILTHFAVAASLAISGAAHAETLILPKVAELALHRVERLVILKKIEETFQSRFRGLSLETIPQETEDAPAFRTTVTQYPAPDGTQKKLELLMNAEGKTLQHTVIEGGEAEGFPQWPDKDPVTLAENSLHWVIEDGAGLPEIAPFRAGLTGFDISAGTDAAGEPVAVVDLRAGEQDGTLRIRMKTNGEFGTAEVIPFQPLDE